MSMVSAVSSISLTGKQDEVRLAIQSTPPLPPKQPLLLVVAQSMELTAIIRDICSQWNLDNPDEFALKFADPPPNTPSPKFGYITEENRGALKNGDILVIALTPSMAATDIYSKMRGRNLEERLPAVRELSELSKDYVFALEFSKLNGTNLLMQIVESGQLTNEGEVTQLAVILCAFQELMEHAIVSWDALTENFVKKLINFVDRCQQQGYFRASIVSRSLLILESIVLNSPKFYTIIEREIKASSVISFVERPDVDVKQCALAFINAMISKSSNMETTIKDLLANKFNRVLQNSVLQQYQYQTTVPREIAHELYVYQSYVMNLIDGRMKMKFSPNDEEDLRLLPTRSFPDDYVGSSRSRVPILDQHWKQLGFLKGGDPRAEFSEIPPGILALDCMVYFAKKHHEVFTRLLFSYADNQCPFAETSIALTKLLIQIFRIGEQPSDIGFEYIPVLVWNEEPFKEVFCIVIQLLFKTWREMRASVLDLEKVMAVVTKQMTTVLQAGTALTSMDSFKQRLFDLGYKKIMELEENSKLLDEVVLKSKPVQELSARIRPQMEKLVQEERLRHMVEGLAFPKVARKGKDQFFYCRLSPNQKVIHFGDTGGNQTPSLEQLDKKIQVSEMRLEVGQNCPHSVKKGGANQYVFSIYYEGDEHLDFVAPNETVFNIWVDGLLVLLGKSMVSKSSEEDIQTLLNMDMKLRLLDIENVTLPTQPPSIPKEPSNYDFYYKLD